MSCGHRTSGITGTMSCGHWTSGITGTMSCWSRPRLYDLAQRRSWWRPCRRSREQAMPNCLRNIQSQSLHRLVDDSGHVRIGNRSGCLGILQDPDASFGRRRSRSFPDTRYEPCMSPLSPTRFAQATWTPTIPSPSSGESGRFPSQTRRPGPSPLHGPSRSSQS